MRLTHFRVTKFRNILDTGEVPVDDLVTCLVGMNEAGKSALLTALNRLNPADEAVFNIQQDYPRWKKQRDIRDGLIDDAIPISGTFAIEATDLAAVETALGPDVIAPGALAVVEMRYGSPEKLWSVTVNEEAGVRNLVSRADVAPDIRATFEGADTVAEFDKRLNALSADEQAKEAADQARLTDIQSLTTARAELDTDDFHDAVVAILEPALPQFFYFSDYQALPGRIDLDSLDLDVNERVGSTPLQTARALLTLAQTRPEDLRGNDYEDRKAELEAVSNDLTDEMTTYWKQNQYLKVKFDVDKKLVGQPHNQQLRSWLDVRVEDTRHGFSNNFALRSSGFRWFFSFLAAFTEFEARKKPFVVLLDEPGVTLHGRAQGDLLTFINARLAPAAQVIYTTHSPFMVETGRLDRVRIVEDGGPSTGAQVSQDVLLVNDDSLFPLQAALGYDVAQHLFIGPTNLLVEGASEVLYLDTISRYLKENGRPHLDEDWRLMPAGSASNIPAFVALIGPTTEVSVLVDGGTEGSQRLQNAMSAGNLQAKRLIDISEITNVAKSDIEDVFEPADYLRLYNAAFGSTVTLDDLPLGNRIVKQLETLRGGKYDHHEPSRALLRQQDDLLPQLSEASLARWATLFSRINASRS